MICIRSLLLLGLIMGFLLCVTQAAWDNTFDLDSCISECNTRVWETHEIVDCEHSCNLQNDLNGDNKKVVEELKKIVNKVG